MHLRDNKVDGLQLLSVFKCAPTATCLVCVCHTTSDSLERRMSFVFDAADHERVVKLRRLNIELIALLAMTINTELDWPRHCSEDSSGESESASEVDPGEILKHNIQSLLEKMQGLYKLLEECQGKLASDHYAQPLQHVLVETMCNAMTKFLDHKSIVMAALDVVASIWDQDLLKSVLSIPSMPTFMETVTTSLRQAWKVFGKDWLEQTKSWSTLGGMMDSGPGRENLVMLDRHLETARGFMAEEDKTAGLHDMAQCAILLNSVVFWQLMTKDQEIYYMKLVSRFALWLVHNFSEGGRERMHLGVLGCEMLYGLAIRHMELGQAQDPVQFAAADVWFRKKNIPQILMVFRGFSPRANKFIDAISKRVPPAEPKPQRKRDRDISPEPSAAGAGPAKRAGGSA